MSKRINEVEIRFPEDRDLLIQEAANFEESCVSIGGLAERFRMLDRIHQGRGVPTIGPMAFAKLVEFWRRQKQLSVEELARLAGLTEAEILEAEDGNTVPDTKVLQALGTVLGVSYEKLLRLTGHIADRNESVEVAAVRFAASSESMERLSRQEEAALREFVRVLAE